VGIDVVTRKGTYEMHPSNSIIFYQRERVASNNEMMSALDHNEGYYLGVSDRGVIIVGADTQGQLYGILTFLQLLDPEAAFVPKVVISDWPRMSFRGLRGHFPKNDPGEIERSRRIIRAMAFCRLNQLWIRDLHLRRFPASLQLNSHPEICDADAIPKSLAEELINYAAIHNVKVMGSLAATADIVWSVYPHLIEMGANESPSTVEIRNEYNRTSKYRFGSRFNFCPSRDETYRLLFDLIDEMAPLFTSEVFDLGVDEIGQEQNGSRWVSDEFCQGKEPVQLFAQYVNRLADYVSSKGKVPLVNSEPFIKKHGGSFHDIYKSVALIRKDVVINNWSEGHVRSTNSGWFNRLSDFESTAYFKRFGLNRIIHMVSAKWRWRDRPELLERLERKGDLDCYGAFITHYSYMTGADSLNGSIVDGMAFSSNHFWTPNLPEMGSTAEDLGILFAKTVIKSVLKGRSFTQAAIDGRVEIRSRR